MKPKPEDAMKKRPNLRNFFYLVGSGFIIQLAGTVYRIWLARRIGPEGLGILQMIYPVYRLLSGLATIGLPLALTKWTAEYLAARQYQELNSLYIGNKPQRIINRILANNILRAGFFILMERKQNMKVAIIGAGLSGLSCAHELQKLGIKPVIFEKKGYIGDALGYTKISVRLFDRPMTDTGRFVRKKFGINIKPVGIKLQAWR
jgi:hypothetical protein